MSRPAIPERWRQTIAGHGGGPAARSADATADVDQRIAALVSDLLPPVAPDAGRLAAIESRLRELAEVPPRRRVRSAGRLALAFGIAVLFVAAGALSAAAASGWSWRASLARLTGRGAAAPIEAPPPGAGAHPRVRWPPAASLAGPAPAARAEALPPIEAPSVAMTPEPASAPAVAPAAVMTVSQPAAEPVGASAPRLRALAARVSARSSARSWARSGLENPPPPPSLETPLGAESRVLGGALALLRQQRDAVGALALLDQHAARFPGGVLGREADTARADALLMLGRLDDARLLLERLPLAAAGREGELLLVRGELRAGADCPGAAADFGRVLAARPSSDWQQRALWGRGICRARLGDAAGSSADLRAYVEEFPQGRHAVEARRRLGP
jgi:hypothetical protein